MKRLVFYFVACILLIGVSEAAQQGGEIKGWGKTVDPEGDCQFVEKDGKLTIKVPGSYHDFTPFAPYKNNGPRVYQEVSGDFVVEVTVAATIVPKQGTDLPGKTNAFRAGTLLVWQDENNFIRLDRTGMWKAGKITTAAYFHVFKDGKRIVEQSPLIKDEVTMLRIERKGGTIYALAKQSKSVVMLSSQKIVLPEKLQVAVGAINASTDPLEAEFSELKITSGKKK